MIHHCITLISFIFDNLFWIMTIGDLFNPNLSFCLSFLSFEIRFVKGPRKKEHIILYISIYLKTAVTHGFVDFSSITLLF